MRNLILIAAMVLSMASCNPDYYKPINVGDEYYISYYGDVCHIEITKVTDCCVWWMYKDHTGFEYSYNSTTKLKFRLTRIEEKITK